jgi:hypothetical protein
MRHFFVVLSLLLVPLSPAVAQVSFQMGLPGINIGINQPVYPRMVAVPGYPVYYAPDGNSNYFFYDGKYWVYQGDNWYASSWYNGPWSMVAPQVVPAFILRVPVRYYRQPPVYFHGWSGNAPPRWGEHWGNDWERQRNGWDKWNHGNSPRPAPLPVYQKQYSGDRYPHPELQQSLHKQNYGHQSREDKAKQAFVAQPKHSPEQDRGSKDKGARGKGEGPEQSGHSGQAKGGGHEREK